MGASPQLWSSFVAPGRKPNDLERSAREDEAVTNHGRYKTKSLPVPAFASKDICVNEEENEKQGTKTTPLWEQKVRFEITGVTSCFFPNLCPLVDKWDFKATGRLR